HSVLTEYFGGLQARLANEEYPSEYNNGTFWIEPMMTFFLFQKRDVNYLVLEKIAGRASKRKAITKNHMPEEL
ncbi:hypothetical protein A0J61_10364, partial [Choanephora cucurbitarum]